MTNPALFPGNGPAEGDPPRESDPQSTAASPPHAPEGWATLDTGETVRLGSLNARLHAWVLDASLVTLMSTAIILMIDLVVGRPEEGLSGIGFAVQAVPVVAVVGAAYEIWPIAATGATIGKRRVGIRVVGSDDGQAPGLRRSAVRFVVSWRCVPVIGWIMAVVVCAPLLWNRTQQGLYDKAAGTLVADDPPVGGRLNTTRYRPWRLSLSLWFATPYDFSFKPEYGKAVLALGFGLWSILVPFVGLLSGVVGLVFSRRALKGLSEQHADTRRSRDFRRDVRREARRDFWRPGRPGRIKNEIRRRAHLAEHDPAQLAEEDEAFAPRAVMIQVQLAKSGLWLSVIGIVLQALMWAYFVSLFGSG